MTLVGRLQARVDGRPITIIGEPGGLLIQTDRLSTLWRARSSWPAFRKPLQTLHELFNTRVVVQWPGQRRTVVHPAPPWYVRLFLPKG